MVLLGACGGGKEAPPAQASRPAVPDAVEDARPVIVAFGDSLSAGYGLEPGKSFMMMYSV